MKTRSAANDVDTLESVNQYHYSRSQHDVHTRSFTCDEQGNKNSDRTDNRESQTRQAGRCWCWTHNLRQFAKALTMTSPKQWSLHNLPTHSERRLIFFLRPRRKRLKKMSLQRLRETFVDSVKACCWRCARCIQSEALLSASTNTFCIRANRMRAKRYQNTRSRAPNSHTKCVLRAHHNCVREDRTTERHGTRMQKRKHKITTSKRLTCSNGSCACLHTE